MALKTAIMSDAHANPAALKRAVADAERMGCGKFVFLGDATGYGYDADETIRIIRARFDVALMGNHDAVACGLDRERSVYENPNYDIDRRQGHELEKDTRQWLRKLPLLHTDGDMAFVHGDFLSPRAWDYIFDAEGAWRNFRFTEYGIMFCGHTHNGCVWTCEKTGSRGVFKLGLKYQADYRPGLRRTASKRIRIGKYLRAIVNVGSVGYPRNDGCASYAVFDDMDRSITIRLLPFDYEGYVKGMCDRGLPVPTWVVDSALDARTLTYRQP